LLFAFILFHNNQKKKKLTSWESTSFPRPGPISAGFGPKGSNSGQIMKKFWKAFGWVCLGIFLQFKFNVLYGIVFLENLNFHDRTYYVRMQMDPVQDGVNLLKVQTIVHHSLGPDYFANVYIPDGYEVLNKEPYLGAEAIAGYKAYQMNMKRKYRDVLSTEDFILVPKATDQEIPPTPLIVHFQNLKQLLHKDRTYQLATAKKKTVLDGPETVEVVYPQHLGM